MVANQLQLDGQGPSMLARFDRDVLSRPGIKSVLVTDSAGVDLIVGVNNPAQDPSTDTQIYALNQLITRAHAHGIKIYAGTILPLALDSGDHHHPNDEGYRLMSKTVDSAWFR